MSAAKHRMVPFAGSVSVKLPWTGHGRSNGASHLSRCDSFDDEKNRKIGRRDNRGAQVGYERMAAIFKLFRQVSPDTLLKINTVVCRENVGDDLTSPLCELRPDRWKALRKRRLCGT